MKVLLLNAPLIKYSFDSSNTLMLGRLPWSFILMLGAALCVRKWHMGLLFDHSVNQIRSIFNDLSNVTVYQSRRDRWVSVLMHLFLFYFICGGYLDSGGGLCWISYSLNCIRRHVFMTMITRINKVFIGSLTCNVNVWLNSNDFDDIWTFEPQSLLFSHHIINGQTSDNMLIKSTSCWSEITQIF